MKKFKLFILATLALGYTVQAYEYTGTAQPNQQVSVVIESQTKRYYVDVIEADENGDYSFSTVLPYETELHITQVADGQLISEMTIITPSEDSSSDDNEDDNNEDNNEDDNNEDDNSGDDNSGDDNSGDDNSGDDSSDDNSSDDNSGGSSSGGSSGGSSSGGSSSTTGVVSFLVDARTVDQDYIVPRVYVDFNIGDTAWDVTQKVLDSVGIDYEYYDQPSVYVQSIAGLGEFDHGVSSGWMYQVNSAFPAYSIDNYTLSDGDSIAWRYTTNFGEDILEDDFPTTGTNNSYWSSFSSSGIYLQDTDEEADEVDEVTDEADEVTEELDEVIEVIEFEDQHSIAPWAVSDVMRARQLGIMGGYEDGTFAPKQGVTRAEFVSILVRAVYGTEYRAQNGTDKFVDVNEQNWFYNVVSVAYEEGIAVGYNNEFRPNELITRTEMAVMLRRALELSYVVPEQMPNDYEDIAKWASADVLATYAYGLIAGIDGNFEPNTIMNRETTAIVAVRAYNYVTKLEEEAKSETELEEELEVETEAELAEELEVETEAELEVGLEAGLELKTVTREIQSYLSSNEVLADEVLANEVLANEVLEVGLALDNTQQYLLNIQPTYGSVGGEWAVFGLSRRGAQVPDGYYEDYYTAVEQIAIDNDANKENGWSGKVTDVQRLAIAVGAIGMDPTDVGGVDLLDYTLNKAANMPYIAQSELGERQGLNELVYGLIAIDLFDSSVELYDDELVQNSRDSIVATIINDYYNEDGGFSLDKAAVVSEFDITAMALQALAKYCDDEEVAKVVDSSLTFLANNLDNNKEDIASEALAQYVVALCALNMDATDVVELLLSYGLEDGSYEHVKGGGSDLMATEQAFYALVAYERMLLDLPRLFDLGLLK
ncbi:MAG: hypothetical protein BEN18_05485 [Epulopiscium sp. Nuni2H_MBin001]|nr:MAG: hypothetical protein BEN18_05485 [Epulopiscium sp. Nuni2H_MBin001]